MHHKRRGELALAEKREWYPQGEEPSAKAHSRKMGWQRVGREAGWCWVWRNKGWEDSTERGHKGQAEKGAPRCAPPPGQGVQSNLSPQRNYIPEKLSSAMINPELPPPGLGGLLTD